MSDELPARGRSNRPPLLGAHARATLSVLVALSSLLGGLAVVGAFNPASLSLGGPQIVHEPGLAAPAPAPVRASGVGALAGNYFTNSPLPLPAASVRPCANGSTNSALCTAQDLLNITNDPSMVYTSTGLLAVAYTAMTTNAPCTASRAYSVTNIGFITSSNNGATWSTPQYLGNSNCTTASATKYTSAWQPALGALSNGTLVLAYVEYNLTGKNVTGGSLPPWWNTYSPPVAQLVFTESYDGGAVWTPQQVLNVSTNPVYTGVYFTPAMPTIATFGKTIYLSWERLGALYDSPTQNSEIALIVSTNGGTTWSPTIGITSASGWAENPSILVTPAGRIFLAYASYPYGATTYYTYVYVATSTSNGTLFTTYQVPSFYYTVPLLGPFYAPILHLAYGETYGRLYITFVASSSDLHGVTIPNAQFVSTANNGSSWSISSAIHGVMYNPSSYFYGRGSGDPRYQPGVFDTAVAVDSVGNVYVSALVRNGTTCIAGECGVMTEVASSTTNNGTSFSPALLVNGDLTTGNGSWFGERTAIVSAGSHLWIAYPQVTCPVWPKLACQGYPAPPLEQSQVTVAQPFTGTGVTLTFHSTGLNATLDWSVNFMTHTFTANGTTDVVLAGVPTGERLFWQVYGLNATSTLRFYPVSQTLSDLTPLSSSATDTISYVRYYPFQIRFGGASASLTTLQTAYENCYNYNTSTNQFTYCGSSIHHWYPTDPVCWAPTYNYTQSGSSGYSYLDMDFQITCASLQVTATGGVGQEAWFQQGSTITASISSRNVWPLILTNAGAPCTPPGWVTPYYIFCDLSISSYKFISWTGTGNSSVVSNQSSISLTLNGPAFEIANVLPTGSCTGVIELFGNPTPNNYTSCQKVTASIAFSETGLPNNLNWGVTLTNSTGSEVETATSPAPINVGGLPMGEIYTLSAWEIPTANPDVFWVGKIAGGDTVVTPFTGAITVAYTKVNVTSLDFQVTLNETGLPSGALWSTRLTSTTLSLNETSAWHGNGSNALTLDYAPDYNLSGLPVYYNNSVSYYLSQVNLTLHNVNATTELVPGTAAFALTSDANITLVYSPEYWLSIVATAGGAAGPASQWVKAGTTVTLSALPNTGYIFVGWSGSGAGSTTAAQRHSYAPTIRPLGPVTEIAVFAVRPPPTYTATFEATGIPASEAYTVVLGGLAYTGVGTFTAGNLSAGTYSVIVPYIYDNTTVGTRYAPTSVVVSGWTGSGSSYTIGANGTVAVAFSSQYLVTLSASAGGTITPAAGAYWYDSDSSVAIAATAQLGYHFVNWGGSGSGSVNTTVASSTLTVLGPVSESALFAVNPPRPPAVFTLTVTESGLPSGTNWNASVPGAGTFGSSSTLVIGGLNGSYTLTVPYISVGSGMRYVANSTNLPVTVTSNSSVSLSFSEQFLVTVTSSGQGSATPGTAWVAAGSTVSLSAVVQNASWKFLTWNGTGSGSYTGANATASVTVNGPITETATFGPIYKAPATPSNATAGLPLALGILVALLAAGLLAGLLVSRRRRAPPAQPVEAWEASPEEGAAEPAGEPPAEGQR